MARPEVRVYVGLGSNVMRRYHLHAALAALGRRFGALQVSRAYQSLAVGFKGPPFCNLVCGFDTILQPVALVRVLHLIERRHGRRRGGRRYASRTLDLDLLVYGDRVHRPPVKPILPHPDVAARAFVLRPPWLSSTARWWNP